VTNLVLASRSSIRRDLLARAGITCRTLPSNVNEDTIKTACREKAFDTQATALELARSKALDVAQLEPHSLVIGADQILDIDNDWLGKPKNREDAMGQLRRLSGRSHRLVTAVSLVRLVSGKAEIWRHCNIATLTMTRLDDRRIEHYLDDIGETAFEAVGAYHVEGRGIRLFDHIDGDFFSILGLPLVPLLRELRARGDVGP
jgi:septum formation protein